VGRVTVKFSARICADLTGASDRGWEGGSGPLDPPGQRRACQVMLSVDNTFYNSAVIHTVIAAHNCNCAKPHILSRQKVVMLNFI